MADSENKNPPIDGPANPNENADRARYPLFAYVQKVKTRFQGQPHLYRSFLDILHSHHKQEPNRDVYSEIVALFVGHQDLIDEFRTFFPAVTDRHA